METPIYVIMCNKELIQVPKLEKKLSNLEQAIGSNLKSLHLLADRTQLKQV